ncbi:MAG: hypothetical protein ACQESJ_06320 [Bacteroidota bacterium]
MKEPKSKENQTPEKIQEKNVHLLKDFEESLTNLSRKTIKRHVNNVEFFINDYLAIDEEKYPEEADKYMLDCFLRWCINKWMFNTASDLCSVISSIKKFYQYLNKKQHVPNNEGIMETCAKKEDYIKKFNIQERKLYD